MIRRWGTAGITPWGQKFFAELFFKKATSSFFLKTATIGIMDASALAACLHRVAKGDQAALELLYKHTSAKLFGICQRILGHQGTAEDVLQEVYLTVWNKAGQFDVSLGVSPITWLAAIARNRSLDYLRGNKRKFDDIDSVIEFADTTPLADAALESVQQDARLKDCLAGLDQRAGRAITAAFFGGLTYSTLAARENMPLATMKSLIRRGLMALKNCLGHE